MIGFGLRQTIFMKSYLALKGRYLQTLGTIFELLVNRDAVSLVRHNPRVNHLVSFECQPAALRDSKIGETLHSTAHRILEALRTCLSLAFASRKGQQEGIAIKMQRQSVIHEDVCFVAMEVAVESSPVPA